MFFRRKVKKWKKFAFFLGPPYNTSRIILLSINILIMKNVIKSGVAGLVALHAGVASAAIDYGKTKVDADVKGEDSTADAAIQTVVGNFMKFLAVIAFLYMVWGAVNILTAGGDEEKVKKGKTIIIQACIGLIVIFLAWSIVNWVITGLLGA